MYCSLGGRRGFYSGTVGLAELVTHARKPMQKDGILQPAWSKKFLSVFDWGQSNLPNIDAHAYRNGKPMLKDSG